MRTLDKLIAPHLKLAPVLVKRAPTLTLAFDERRKSRLAATLDNGEDVALLLPRGTVLRDGDVLVADDGGLVRVVAAPQAVLVVRAKDALTLTRAAYHLGNRHTPVEVGADYLKLEYDPVLADMLKRIGATVDQVSMPFQPESGAYGGGHKHGHDETFAEDYALAQQVFGEHHHGDEHSHDHEHGHAHGHRGADANEHAQGHSHDHGHDHDHSHDHGTHDHAEPDHVHDESCGHGHHRHHAHR